MARRLLVTVLVALSVAAATLLAIPPAGITFVGRGSVSGSALDKSGLTGQICQAGNPGNCVPKAILGGFGSGITYTGHDDVYIAAPDRGPFDGLTDVPYLNRVDFFHIALKLGAPFPNITTTLLDTRFLKNEVGQVFLGAAGAFDTSNASATLRLDPEGVRASADGTFYVSDEYGPYVFEFDRQGNLLRRIPVPARYAIANPNSNPALELSANTSGRQANRGMEGLAISPDGETLYGLMQNALIQDGGFTTGTTNRLGVNNRILKIDRASGQTKEYVYVLDAIGGGQGANEILAINDHQFLVVERDNRSWLTMGNAPQSKRIYKIDIADAIDVSGTASLPAGALPAGVLPATKTLFIDMLDPAFGLNLNNANAIAEKVEGLAWGPDLPDGRHLLYVLCDNDLMPTLPTQIFAFAINASQLMAPQGPLNLQEQFLPGPLYPPGQVKKALGK